MQCFVSSLSSFPKWSRFKTASACQFGFYRMQRGQFSGLLPAARKKEESRHSYLRRTPPSKEALRHSGGERRLWTSATVTLYFEVELRSESRPGTEQKTSLGLITTPRSPSFWHGRPNALCFISEMGPTEPRCTEKKEGCWFFWEWGVQFFSLQICVQMFPLPPKRNSKGSWIIIYEYSI